MNNKTIKAKELYKELEGPNDSLCIIDVRSEDEFNSGTISGAQCIPHTEIHSKLDSIPKDKKIVLFCKSGTRSNKAHQVLCKLDNVHQLEGGIDAWQAAQLPINKKRASSISIQRQVMIVAGILITSSILLAIFVNPRFNLLALFVGLGLSFAGLSGFCGMALVLEKMPWNKIEENKCQRM